MHKSRPAFHPVWGSVVVAATVCFSLVVHSSCTQEQSPSPQQQKQQPPTFNWRGTPVPVEGSYEHSVQSGSVRKPNDPSSGSPASQPKNMKLAKAVLPSQALSLLHQYLAASDFEAMYDHFLADNQKKLLTKEEFKKRMQDNYYQVLRLTVTLSQEEPRYVVQGRSPDGKQRSYYLHPSRMPKTEGELWGVGFRCEKACWKLEQFRPEILGEVGQNP